MGTKITCSDGWELNLGDAKKVSDILLRDIAEEHSSPKIVEES